MKDDVAVVAVALAIVDTAIAEEPLVDDRPTVTERTDTTARHTPRLDRGVARREDTRGDELFTRGRDVPRDVLERGSGLRPAGAEPRSGSRVARRIGE